MTKVCYTVPGMIRENANPPGKLRLTRWAFAAGLLFWILSPCERLDALVIQDPAVEQLRTRAIQKAVGRANPSLIRLDIFSRTKPQLKVGTGVVISKEGYILTSSFFVPDSETILVADLNGSRVNTQLIGIDRPRALALLRLDTEQTLVPIEIEPKVPEPGSTAIAVGKVFSGGHPNVSVGIVSAVNRIWGRAMQTDARISPLNYGGALLNLHGKAVGILSPVSPVSENRTLDSDWYDSGIGFAVPIQDALDSAQRIKNNGDLQFGKLGIRFRDNNLYRNDLTVEFCFPGSPARESGMRAGDRITHVDGQPVKSLSRFKFATGRYYAGDNVEISVDRKGTAKSFKMTFASKLQVFKYPYLGILPDSEFSGPGVRIKSVDRMLPKSGLKPGEIIEQVEKTPVRSVSDLESQIAEHRIGDTLELQVRSDGELRTIKTRLSSQRELAGIDSFEIDSTGALHKSRKRTIEISGYRNRCVLTQPLDAKVRVNTVFLILAESPDDPRVGQWDRLVSHPGLATITVYPTELDGWQVEEVQAIRNGLARGLQELGNREDVHLGLMMGEKSQKIGLRLIHENRARIRAVLMMDPEFDASLAFPFAEPGRPLFFLLMGDGPRPVGMLVLQKMIQDNGLPAAIAPLDENSGKRFQTIIRWIQGTRRI